jgi:UrcA family protein
MNTETGLSRDSLRPHTRLGTIALLMLFGLVPAVTLADPPTVPVVATRSAKVSLADLDLSTPAGARVAYERISRLAERLCDDRGDPWNKYHAATYAACVRESVADAVRQIQAPALAALEK